jgi:hypothetical protein
MGPWFVRGAARVVPASHFIGTRGVEGIPATRIFSTYDNDVVECSRGGSWLR